MGFWKIIEKLFKRESEKHNHTLRKTQSAISANICKNVSIKGMLFIVVCLTMKENITSEE